MNSSLYRGLVKHRRSSPKEHQFSYTLFMLFIDLDELPTVFARFWLWSNERFNLAQFKRSDHMKGKGDLKDTVLDCVELYCGDRPEGRVCLLTHLRYFGVGFNPVSFYYCYHKDQNSLHSIVVEVNNTPWGEQHVYVLPCSEAQERDQATTVLTFKKSKEFHVSPFLPMDMEYTWHITKPGDRIDICITNLKDDKLVFDATLTLEQHDITSANMRNVLLSFPLMTLKVLASIYFEALSLWLKRMPYYAYVSKAEINK
ncbi:MAG: DUF1365 family protein [Saprospiraceae bacterium]|jgi:DUF1365 family protein